jgi:sialate O-acetylesterase
MVSKTFPNAYMASIMDIGDMEDIHPKPKRPVGERLALLARSKVYGEEVICEPPEPETYERTLEGVDMHSKNTGGKLELRGDFPQGLEVFDKHGRAISVSCSVSMNTLSIVSEMSIKEIRFSWLPYTEVNLFNVAGLPAKPFRYSFKEEL